MTDVLFPSSPAFDMDRGTIALGDRRLVFHCHHYNVYLQRTIEDGLKDRARGLLIAAGMEAARAMLGGLEEKTPSGSPAASLARAAEVFRDHGFGRLDVSELSEGGGIAVLERSHYAVGWLAKWGQRQEPGCFYAVGFVGGAVAVAGKIAPERITAREVECLATGAASCRIVVEVW